jgi:hypothetical protein
MAIGPDFSLGGKWDAMLYAMKEARYYLMLRKSEERSFGESTAIGILGVAIAHAETHDNDAYVKQICAVEPWPPTYPEKPSK